MEIVIIWLVFCVLVGAWANSRGKSGIGFFFLSLFLSPLIGAIVVLIVGPNQSQLEKNKIQTEHLKKCEHCAELIKDEAKVCRFCGREVKQIDIKHNLMPVEDYCDKTSCNKNSTIRRLRNGKISGRQIDGEWFVKISEE